MVFLVTFVVDFLNKYSSTLLLETSYIMKLTLDDTVHLLLFLEIYSRK